MVSHRRGPGTAATSGLIVRDPGIDNMTQMLVCLLDDEDFTQVLQRLDNE
ncbi:hypothetical protein [Streptomyces sp. C1-2]